MVGQPRKCWAYSPTCSIQPDHWTTCSENGLAGLGLVTRRRFCFPMTQLSRKYVPNIVCSVISCLVFSVH
jgi:hypothetical protein